MSATYSSSPTVSEAALISSMEQPSLGKPTFSATVPSNIQGTWLIMPRCLCRETILVSDRSCPSKSTLPDDGR